MPLNITTQSKGHIFPYCQIHGVSMVVVVFKQQPTAVKLLGSITISNVSTYVYQIWKDIKYSLYLPRNRKMEILLNVTG